MKTSITRMLITALLAGLFVASVGMASAGSLGYFRTSASEKAPASSLSTAKSVKVHQDKQTTKSERRGETVSREAECRAAAGMSTVGDGGGSSETTVAGGTAVLAKKKGLDRAIEVVLANCIKNPQPRGLVNALRHLAENRDRHMAREADKAVRRALREAKKAARHTVSSGHGKGTGKTSA
jgi:hypothetical protein